MKRLNATRQQRIAGLVSVGILAMVVYITGSVFEWQLYNDSTKNASSHAKSVVTKALEPSAKTPAQNQKSLLVAADELVTDESTCQPTWWIRWQTIFPSLNDMVKSCEVSVAKQTALKKELDKVNMFLADEQHVAIIINRLPSTDTTLTDKTWDTTITKWTSVSTDLASYKSSDDYQPVIVVLRTQTNKALSAWKEIKAADKKQNKQGYEAAYDKLDQAVTGMIAAADKSDAALKILLAKATIAAQKL